MNRISSKLSGNVSLLFFIFALCPAMTCSAGSVVAWGDDTFGQTNVPLDLTNTIAIAGGQNFSMALRLDSTVAAWGDNSSGQTNVPVDLSNVVAIAAGGYHALALKADGTVAAWGAGLTSSGASPEFGQSIVPSGLTNVVAIAAGLYHSAALRADGTIVTWGDNSHLQTNVPASLTNAMAIAAGDYHSLALRTDGTVTAWGDNSSGQINVPGSLSSTPVTAIAAGGTHSLALQADGRITAWGSQTNIPFGLFGYNAAIVSMNAGTTETSNSKPAGQDGNVVVDGGTNGPMIVYGGVNGLAAMANGRINYNTNYLNLPASAYSMTNWGTANQIPDYTAQGTANTLFDFNRFIAVADLTPHGYSPSGNNHFTNISSFMLVAHNYSNAFTKAMEGVVAVDLNINDPNTGSLTTFPFAAKIVVTIDSKTGVRQTNTVATGGLPTGINVHGTFVMNFTGSGWDPVAEKVIVTAPININAADLSGLVATNPATYTTGYPPVYSDPTKNPTNIDVTSRGYTNFTASDDFPALIGTGAGMDFHGDADVCGMFYTPSYVEIENFASGQTQYFRGTLMMGHGTYLENTRASASTSVFSSDSDSTRVVAIASRAGHNLALNSAGKAAAWGSLTDVPLGLANVTAIAAGANHSLALVGSGPPLILSQATLTNLISNASGFSFSLPTQNGKVYAMEYKNSLTDNNWTALPLTAGTGGVLTLTDPTGIGAQRYYRVRQW